MPTTFIFLLGLVLGSFYGVVVHRVPRQQSIVYPRSSCPRCHRRLSMVELIPLIGYLIARGHCQGCRVPISIRYPITELVTALGFVGIYLTSQNWQEFVAGAVFFSFLWIMALIDLEHMLLPDVINIIGAITGIVLATSGWTKTSLGEALGGACLGYGLVLLIVVISRGGMGMGDGKFLGMIGTYVGLGGVFYTLLAASILGSTIGFILIALGRHKRKAPIPFGPFLAIGALVIWLVGSEFSISEWVTIVFRFL